MNEMRRVLLSAAILLTSSAYAQAPNWSDAQVAIWAVVKQSWQDDAAENGRWPGAYASENFVAWGESTPMPRNLETYTAWERATEEVGDTVWHEITPLAIAIQGDTAVVMYSLLIGEEDDKGERNLNALNLVEVLNREGRNWKYVATANFSPDYGN